MKIKRVEPIILYAHDSVEGTADEANVGGYTGYQVVVRIETDEGIEGWGECATYSDYGEAAEAVAVLIKRGLAPRLTGEDPTEYRRIWDKLYQAMEWYGRRGISIIALSGIDTALMDITARARGVPIYALLGGKRLDEVPLYASLLFDMDDPSGTAEKALGYVKRGYIGTKCSWGTRRSRPFGANREEDERIVATVRETIGPKPWLMIDVGRYVNWTPSYAIQMAERLRKYDIFWLEEALPQDDIDGFVQLASSTDVTIAAGEGYQTIHEFKELITRKAVDLIQPDVSKAGGISETQRIIDLAHMNNVRWVPHNWSTAINTAASLQLVAALPGAFLLEFKEEPNPLVHFLAKGGFEIKSGKLSIPDKPGLGIEIDEDVVARYSEKTRS